MQFRGWNTQPLLSVLDWGPQHRQRKFDSYLGFLSAQHNGGVSKRWYGKTKEHKQLLAEGKLAPWEDVVIRCHDFRVSFCTMCYEANVPMKTLQVWMGHADIDLIMSVYTKLTAEKEQADAELVNNYCNQYFSA